MEDESTYREVSRRERALRAVSLFALGTLVIIGGTFNAISTSSPAWLIVDLMGLVCVWASYQAWTTTQRKVPAPTTSSPPKTQRLWIYADNARHGWRAWLATGFAVSGWTLYSAGSIYMLVHGTAQPYRGNWWLMPALGAFGCLAGICVAPAGAAEIWSVMVKRAPIEEVERCRHKAGVATAWLVAGAIAIALFFMLPPESWHRDIGYAIVYGVIAVVIFWQVDNYIANKLRILDANAEARDARLNERIDRLQREIARINRGAHGEWEDDSY